MPKVDTRIQAVRYHDISCGHRVHGHESKCAHLHGHNYRITFGVETSTLDSVGRVLDFEAVKTRLCMWLEEHWDHKFLAWEQDTVMRLLRPMGDAFSEVACMYEHSIVWTPFNPTAENMAAYLLEVIGPQQLQGSGVILRHVRVDETRKCSASAWDR